MELSKSVLHSAILAVSNVAQTQRAHGIDISKYDKFFQPETATGQLDFVVQRIGYGLFRDEAFETLVGGVMQVPIRGGYHYLTSGVSWKAQADLFLQHVEGRRYHFFACDFEGYYNEMSPQFAHDAWQWIEYVAKNSGVKTILYTNPSNYDGYISPSVKQYGIDWDDVDLWLAQYWYVPDPNKNPSMPKGRTDWRIWQYTSKGNGTQYGVSRPTACDLNVFNGTVAEMRSWLGLDSTPPPPDPPANKKMVIEFAGHGTIEIARDAVLNIKEK